MSSRNNATSTARGRASPPPSGRLVHAARLGDLGKGEFLAQYLAGGNASKGQGHSRGVLREAQRVSNELGALDRPWLLSVMAERGLSQRQVASNLGCDPASVNRMLQSHRPMRLDEVPPLAFMLGVSAAELLSHAGIDLGIDDAPVFVLVPLPR